MKIIRAYKVELMNNSGFYVIANNINHATAKANSYIKEKGLSEITSISLITNDDLIIID